MIEIHALSARPDLLETGADWSWQQWGAAAGRTRLSVRERGARYLDPAGFDQCFMLLEDGTPAAMASLSETDLDLRPDLSPWLAGVYVAPAFRGRGHAIRVVRHVEQAAQAAGVATLWLFTWTAAPLYRRLGWHDVAPIETRHGPSLIMRRDLSEAFPAGPQSL